MDDWNQFFKKNRRKKLFRLYPTNSAVYFGPNNSNSTNKQMNNKVKPKHVFLSENILLPDGDILLGVQEIHHGYIIDECFFEFCPIQYFKLSEIRLLCIPDDEEEFF